MIKTQTWSYGINDYEKTELLPYLSQILSETILCKDDEYYLFPFGENTEEQADHVARVLNGIALVKYDCSGLSRYIFHYYHKPKTAEFFARADEEQPSFALMFQTAKEVWPFQQALAFLALSTENEERELYQLATVFYYLVNSVGYERLLSWVEEKDLYMFLQWISNAYISGSRAVHSAATSNKKEAEAIIESEGDIKRCPLNLNAIFKQWVKEKEDIVKQKRNKIGIGVITTLDYCLDRVRKHMIL